MILTGFPIDTYIAPPPNQPLNCRLSLSLIPRYCWQQGLSNGDWDAAVCDKGVSRWFNYYISGLEWSTNQAPHIDGIYYDGINYDRKSFRRVRKVLDRAAAARGRGRPQIDIHTGEVSTAPSSVRYLSHFPYVPFWGEGERGNVCVGVEEGGDAQKGNACGKRPRQTSSKREKEGLWQFS